MKIGIVTFNSAHNYGAVLQAWSLQTFLEKQGHTVDIINYRPLAIDNVYVMAKRKKYIGINKVNALLNKMVFARNCMREPKKYKRYKAFENFIAKDLHTTKAYRTLREIKADKRLKYDILIAGSDQIWNSNITKKADSTYFLNFGQAETKRISYAASIGGKELPETEHGFFQNFLERMDYISVREVNAQKAIAPLTDKKVELVADPTFLLKREDFDTLKKPFPVDKPYIYVHNVHLVREDTALNEVAEELSKKTGLPIVSNRKEKYFSKEEKKFLTGTPQQFIGVIAEAEYVVTNSFHATVFAIIYNRKFITVPHFSNPDRMQNLLMELGIEDHLIQEAAKVPENIADLEIDYVAVEEKKEVMGENSRKFLQKALKGPKHTGEVLFNGICVSELSPVKKGVNLVSAKKKNRYQDNTLNDVLVPIAEKIIKEKGYLVLPIYDENMKMVYQISDDIQILKKAVLPEVFEADIVGIYEKVQELLQAGKKVLFVGNPCRNKALKTYLKGNFENLYVVGTMCHGIGNAEIYNRYVEELEQAYKSKMMEIEFHNKFRRPEEEFFICHFESGAVMVEDTLSADISYAVKQNMVQIQPCYNCVLRTGITENEDILIGNLDEYSKVKGMALREKYLQKRDACLCTIVSEKGAKLFGSVRSSYTVVPLPQDELAVVPMTFNLERGEFEMEMEKGGSVQENLLKFNKTKKRRKNR